MDNKKRINMLHDINAIFDSVYYELCSEEKNWIITHLKEGVNITSCDFPHLLTMAKNYNAVITIFVVKLNQLGIMFRV